MSRIAVAAQQAVFNCRWSRAGFDLFGVGEPRQPESLWVCLRNGRPQNVTDEQCEKCPHWELDDSPED